ncbi:carboxypeptidase-like regulatory domain-containing protein [Tenacibaculum soleae]|uniref:TonB-dependent receptor n=1 Tax=Tenacibaculum soleae TaxID=447689 RepID=UPI0026E12DB8|nr:carboxypeptidase-like regulatory domain-containing protein [Tenacibaculum soleae]MDO6744763.1 carboxypeptidase-like regulatory domain-containing protein [Tenacibaculum soleae]
MKRFILFLLINITLSITAQTKTRLTPLKKVLTELNDLYRIKFSFSDEVVNTKKVFFEKKNELSLIINDLQQQTKLYFQKKSKDHYIISLPKNKINICGSVFSKKNKESLIGGTVLIKNKNIGTETNIDGFFELKNVRVTDTIGISYIGFKKREIIVADFLFEKCKSIFLEQEASVLKEIIVTNYITNGISKNIDGSIAFKPKNQDVIPGLTEPDVFYTVQQLPGVINVDETASGIHIRGGTPDQNLILFNQIKLFSTSHFFGAISALNPEIIDKVNVYKKASNAKYGNHIGGVIDVETGSEIPKKTKGSIGLNFTHGDANLNIPISSKLSLLISGRRSITDVLNTPTFRNLSQKSFQNTVISEDEILAEKLEAKINTSIYFQDFNTKLTYKPSKNDKISFSQIEIKNSLDHSFLTPDFNDNRSDELLLKNTGCSIEWEKKWNSNLLTKIATSYSNYNLRYRNSKKKEDVEYALTNKDNRVKNIDVISSLDYKLTKKSLITLGYQYTFNDVHFLLKNKNDAVFIEKEAIQDEKNASHTLFTEYTYNKNKAIILNLGNRINYFSLLDKITFEPRIYTQIQLLPKFWLNSSFEIKQQNISKIIEFYTTDFGLENQLWSLSNNKNIPLLESQQISFGLLFNKNNWLIDLDFYKKNINGITSLTSGFDTFTEEILTGKSKTLGLDFLIKKSWKNYNTWLSYHTGKKTFLINDFNKNEEFTGNADVTHSFYLANNYKYKNVSLSLGFTYRTGIPFTSNTGVLANNYFIERNGVNDSKLPNYLRLDFSTGYDFYLNSKKTMKGKITVSLLNILNKKNILKRVYDVVQNDENGFIEGELLKQDTESLGFTPNVSFRLSF